MAYGDSDRAYLLGADFGVDVTYSGTTVDGHLDEVTEEMLPGVNIVQLGIKRSALIATGSITPVAGNAITVDGGSYTVYAVYREGPDGRLTRVFLADV